MEAPLVSWICSGFTDASHCSRSTRALYSKQGEAYVGSVEPPRKQRLKPQSSEPAAWCERQILRRVRLQDEEPALPPVMNINLCGQSEAALPTDA